MATRGSRAGLRWLWLSALVIVLDQYTKWLALGALREFERVAVIEGFWDWTLTYNEGVAFSLFNDGPAWTRYGLSAFAVVVSAVFAVWLARLPRGERWQGAALALVIGGALGNVIDRLRLGHVVDFVLWYWKDWHWPAFNVADSAITAGAVLLVVSGLFAGKPAPAGGARR